MGQRPVLYSTAQCPVGVTNESDLANFGQVVLTFPAGIPCWADDTQTLYVWDPSDTTTPSAAGSAVAALVVGVQVGTWLAVGGGNAVPLSVNTVVGAGNTLKNLIPATARTASVKGYYVAGDGGSAGLYFWDPTYAGAANDGTIVRPTAAVVGAWFAIFSGAVNVRWFGAKGDGISDDRPFIQTAITAVPATGGSVYFPNGTFLMSTATAGVCLTTLGKNALTLYSDGPDAIISLAVGLRGIDINGSVGFQMYGLDWKGTIIANGGNPGGGNETQTAVRIIGSASNIDIHDCLFLELGGYAIFPSKCSDVNLHHNSVIRTMAGIQGGGDTVNDIWITDNFFEGYVGNAGAGFLGSDDQIAFFGSGTAGTNGQCVIARNIIDKKGSTSQNQARCIDVTSDPAAAGALIDVYIVDNICINCITTNVTNDRPAIVVAGNAANSFRSVTVSRNQIRNCNEGIEVSLANVQEIEIDDNIISDIVRLAGGTTIPCAIRTITVGGGVVRGSVCGNIIRTTGGTGAGAIAAIQLETVVGFEVCNNVIRSAGDIGIFVTGGSSNVDVSHNTVEIAANSGIILFTVTSGRCCNNEILLTASHGLQIISCSGSVISGNTSRSGTLAGILIQSTTNCSVNDNNSHNNGLYGFVELVANTGLTCVGNNFHNNTGVGISLQGTNSNGVFANNRLNNNAAPLGNTSVTSRWWFTDNPELDGIGMVGNNRGQAVIANAAVAIAVVFPVAEPDANYLISLSAFPSAGAAATSENVFWNAKVAGGFTINTRLAPGAGQTVTIDWKIHR